MNLLDFLILILLPVAIFILSLLYIPKVRKNKKHRYILPIVLVDIGVLVHFIGIFVIRGFEGLGISLIGASIVLISAAIFIPMLLIDYIKKRNSMFEDKK